MTNLLASWKSNNVFSNRAPWKLTDLSFAVVAAPSLEQRGWNMKLNETLISRGNQTYNLGQNEISELSKIVAYSCCSDWSSSTFL